MAEKGSAKSTRPSNYGTPVEGSKTEERGRKAHERLSKEIVELCEIIGEAAAAGIQDLPVVFLPPSRW